MKEKDRKTPTVTTKLRATTKAQLKSQAQKAGLNLSEYVQDLADRASGFGAVKEITLPKKELIHPVSFDKGYASGVIATLALMAETFGMEYPTLRICSMLKVNPLDGAEWDLRVLRVYEPDIPKGGALPRNHPRAPKEKTGQTAVTI